MDAKKRLGQNFLIDKTVIQNIINVIPASTEDLIVEIGPGRGALTKELKKKNCQLICFEIDEDLKSYLLPLEDDKVKIIWKDILTSDLHDAIKNYSYNNLYIVGNLPYYITTPIIKYLISEDLNAKELIFMVQKEVADRYSANPNSKDYGSMTLYLKYFFDIEKVFQVSKNSFYPVPKVESAIIKLKRREAKPKVNEKIYFKLLDDSFKLKRKTLRNNLKNYNYDIIQEVLNKNNLKDNVRAEEIEEKVFIEIANNLERK